MFSWNSLAFLMIQQMLAIWSLVPLPFLKPAWTPGSPWFTYCSKAGLENFEHYFTSVWDECNCAIVWAFFGIAFTELLIHPWTSASFLESFACAWISESLCVVNYFLCISLSLLNIFSRRDMICYFLHLMLTSYSEFSSIAYPCGDLWHKFIISVVVFEVWVIAH